MSAIPPGGRVLDGHTAVPPRKQRILAPSLVGVVNSDMGSQQCVCTLRITDPVNLAIYYVPLTRKMALDIIIELGRLTNPRDEATTPEGSQP